MPPEDVIQQTQKAAHRLLKSRIRTFLFTKLRGHEPLLIAEEGLARAAEREWQGVLPHWDRSNELTVDSLATIVLEAFPEAAGEVLAIFDDPWEARAHVDQFRGELDVDTFVRVGL